MVWWGSKFISDLYDLMVYMIAVSLTGISVILRFESIRSMMTLASLEFAEIPAGDALRREI